MASSSCSTPSRLPLRAPEDRQEYRRSLYKSSSPHWRGAYRERCKKRLRASREKFLSRFRDITEGEDPPPGSLLAESPLAKRVSTSDIASSVQEVMMEEWERVRMEYGNLPQVPLSKRSKSDDLEEDVELVLSIMDELTAELIKEEQALLTQYEEDLRCSEDALCDAVQGLSTDDIVCPICKKDFLHQNKHIIFCSCGIRLDVAHDGISLGYIRKQLDHYSVEHSSQCSGKAHFSLENVLDTQTITMTCPTCCFVEIIV